jgi:MFS family permease
MRASPSVAAEPRGSMFRSLSIRNYRLYFTGQLVSVCGTWMQSVAQATYVLFRLDGGGRELGILSACTFLPILMFGLWAGAVVDRSDKRKLLIRAQSVMLVAALGQTMAILTGHATFPVLCAIAAVFGTANAFEMPGRQAFITELVGPEDVPNAVGLNSAIFNSGRIVGQGIGGVLIATLGYAWCFAINAASYFAILIGLFLMRPGEFFAMTRAPRAKGQIREGLTYVKSHPVLRTILSLVLIVGTFSLNFQVFVPLLAKEVFHGGEGKVAFYQVLMGVGSLAGSLLAARRVAPSPRVLIGAACTFGGGLMAMALNPWEPATWALLCITGAGFITFMLTANATLQLSSDPARRGRVMALYAFVFAGTTPIGAPLVGWVADVFGPRHSVALGGTAAIAANRRGLVRADPRPTVTPSAVTPSAVASP